MQNISNFILFWNNTLHALDGESSETCRVLLKNKIKFEILCIWLVLQWKYFTMRGPTNVKRIMMFLRRSFSSLGNTGLGNSKDLCMPRHYQFRCV